MNERFRELAEKARKKPMGNSWAYASTTEFEKRFAELIVRECIVSFGKTRTEPSLEKYILDSLGIHNEQK